MAENLLYASHSCRPCLPRTALSRSRSVSRRTIHHLSRSVFSIRIQFLLSGTCLTTTDTLEALGSADEWNSAEYGIKLDNWVVSTNLCIDSLWFDFSWQWRYNFVRASSWLYRCLHTIDCQSKCWKLYSLRARIQLKYIFFSLKQIEKNYFKIIATTFLNIKWKVNWVALAWPTAKRFSFGNTQTGLQMRHPV